MMVLLPKWQRLDQMSNRVKNLWLAGLALGFTAGAVCLLVWLPAVMVQWTIKESAPGDLDQEALTTAITANRQAVLFAIGGVIAVITLLITLAKHSLDRESHSLDRDSNWTSRYTEAIAQLGDESLPIRLGGIYAMERIAQDSLRDRQTILDVLCAYLRHKCPRPPKGREIRVKHGADISAAVSVITRITMLSKPKTPVNLNGTRLGDLADFRGANLEGANLRYSDFNGGNFAGANLARADLIRVNFSGAELSKANLSGSLLLLTNLSFANLQQANFSGARMTGATLDKAKMKGMNVAKAELRSATVLGIDEEQSQQAKVSLEFLANQQVVGIQEAIFN